MSDSIVNDGLRLIKRLKSPFRSIYCATIKEISRHAKVCLIKSSPDDIANNLIKPSTSVKASTNKVFVTGITKTNDKWDGKGRKAYFLLRYFVNLLIYHILATIILTRKCSITVIYILLRLVSLLLETIFVRISDQSCSV